MKLLNIFAIVFLLFPCTKKDALANEDFSLKANPKQVSKISATNNPDFFFKYDAEGRLSEIAIDTVQQFVFDYRNNSFAFSAFMGKKLWQQASNSVLVNQKLSSHNLQYYNTATGKPSSNYKFEFEYNADGSLSSFKRFGSIYKLEYSNGNFTSLTEEFNGTVMETNVFEYYNSANKFNIPYTEFLNKFPYLYNAFAGNKNKDLIKKAINTRFGTVTVVEYSYTFDKDGYVTEIKSIHKTGNDAPVVRIDTISYK